MPAAEFKARCLAVMDDVCATGEAVVITKRGRAVAQLVPAKTPSAGILGRLRGVVQVKGKITDPAVPPEDWEPLA